MAIKMVQTEPLLRRPDPELADQLEGMAADMRAEGYSHEIIGAAAIVRGPK